MGLGISMEQKQWRATASHHSMDLDAVDISIEGPEVFKHR
jgi:hypothetical protein